jgi:hypothetical protein
MSLDRLCRAVFYFVLYFALFNWLRGGYGAPSSQSTSTMQKYERGATHSSFSVEFVDVIPILNTKRATSSRYQVQLAGGCAPRSQLATRNTSHIKRVYDLSTLQQIKSCLSTFILVLVDTGRRW